MMGPRTTWDLTIVIIVLQGLNVGALWTDLVGSTWSLRAAVFCGIASSVLTFMVTGILRPPASK